MKRFGLPLIVAVCCGFGALTTGCTRSSGPSSETTSNNTSPDSVSQQQRVEEQPAAKLPSSTAPDGRPIIVTFGDSLTAGVVPHAYPEYLQQLLDRAGYGYRVDNQGVSGDTTTDGLARIGNVIAAHPDLIILEFGGNDGLRGVPVESTKANLQAMVEQFKKANLATVLAGITLPPNYGPDYVKPFTSMYGEVAKQYNIRVLPFLLADVYQHPDMMQPDGIHPNEKGNQVVAQDVFRFIEPRLKRSRTSAR